MVTAPTRAIVPRSVNRHPACAELTPLTGGPNVAGLLSLVEVGKPRRRSLTKGFTRILSLSMRTFLCQPKRVVSRHHGMLWLKHVMIAAQNARRELVACGLTAWGSSP